MLVWLTLAVSRWNNCSHICLDREMTFCDEKQQVWWSGLGIFLTTRRENYLPCDQFVKEKIYPCLCDVDLYGSCMNVVHCVWHMFVTWMCAFMLSCCHVVMLSLRQTCSKWMLLNYWAYSFLEHILQVLFVPVIHPQVFPFKSVSVLSKEWWDSSTWQDSFPVRNDIMKKLVMRSVCWRGDA